MMIIQTISNKCQSAAKKNFVIFQGHRDPATSFRWTTNSRQHPYFRRQIYRILPFPWQIVNAEYWLFKPSTEIFCVCETLCIQKEIPKNLGLIVLPIFMFELNDSDQIIGSLYSVLYKLTCVQCNCIHYICIIHFAHIHP